MLKTFSTGVNTDVLEKVANAIFQVDAGSEFVNLATSKLKIGGTGLAGGFLKCTDTSTATVEYATLSWSDLPAISTLAEI